jgi:hypothetical protein
MMNKFMHDIVTLEKQLQEFTNEEIALSGHQDLNVFLYLMKRERLANGIRRKLLRLYRYIGKPKKIREYLSR